MLCDEYDVVVIGFGIAGAAAAIGAAESGARVLILDRERLSAYRPVTTSRRAWRGEASVAVRRRIVSVRRRSRGDLRDLRAAAVAAGVDVCGQSVVHELMVEGGVIRGVGYATLNPSTIRGTFYWGLSRLGAWTSAASRKIGRAVSDTAETVWQQASSVEMARCSAVVLGIDRNRWDFVGPAVWAVMGAASWWPEEQGVTGTRQRLGVVRAGEEPVSRPTPELAVRKWCATQATGRSGGLGGALRVERGSGEVHVGELGIVPALYAADPEAPELSTAVRDIAKRVAAATQAGRSAATGRPQASEGDLRLVV
jgi:hypothetical protein